MPLALALRGRPVARAAPDLPAVLVRPVEQALRAQPGPRDLQGLPALPVQLALPDRRVNERMGEWAAVLATGKKLELGDGQATQMLDLSPAEVHVPGAAVHFEHPKDSNMTTDQSHASISAGKRKSLPASAFGDPSARKYPLDSAARTRNAAARLEQNKSGMSQSKYRQIRARIARAATKFGIESQYNEPQKSSVAAQPRMPEMRLAIRHHDGTRTEIHHRGLYCDKTDCLMLSALPIDPKDVLDGDKRVWIQIGRTGSWLGHPQGPFRLDSQIFATIIHNFETQGDHRVPVDFEHASELPPNSGTIPVVGAPAQGWVHALKTDGSNLYALVEWGDLARQYIEQGKYRGVSPAIRWKCKDRENGSLIGPCLTSVALTNQPFIDGMMPIAASDRVLLSESICSDDLRGLIGAAVDQHKLFKRKKETDPSAWVRDVFPDEGKAIVSCNGKLFELDYNFDGKVVSLGDVAREVHATYAPLTVAGCHSARCLSAVEALPRIKAALRLSELATSGDVAEHLDRLEEHLVNADDDMQHEGLNLRDFLHPLRDVANPNANATWQDVLDIIRDLIDWGHGEHEEANDMPVTSSEPAAAALAATENSTAPTGANIGDTMDVKELEGLLATEKGNVQTLSASVATKDAELAALTKEAEELRRYKAEHEEREVQARVSDAIATYATAKGLTEDLRDALVILYRKDAAAFDTKYPVVASEKRHLLKNLTGDGRAAQQGGAPRVEADAPTKEEKTLASVRDLTHELQEKQGLAPAEAQIAAERMIRQAKQRKQAAAAK